MSSVLRRTAALAVLVALLPAALSGCTADKQPRPPAGAGEGKPAAGQPKGLGDIIVAGRAVTGAKPTGLEKAPYQRTYTDGELYAAVTGYRSTTYAQNGLEAVYEDVLGPAARHGGRAPGDVVTTIDPALQKAAADGLGGRKGAAVALDVKSGRIEALVSAPSFDPATFSGNMPEDAEAWEELESDEDDPKLNRALRQAVAPGDTFHLVVAAAAVEQDLYSSVDAPTRSPLTPGVPARCESASLRTALRFSCDNVFARIATDLGEGTLAQAAEAFGFNDDRLDVPVRAVTSTYPRGADGEADLAATGNGLGGVTATPVQMATVMAVLAGGGGQVRPTMVDHVVRADGSIQRPAAEGAPGRVVAQATADQLRSALGPSASRTAWVAAAADDGDGDGAGAAAWSVSYARTGEGGLLAIAVCVEGSDGAAPAVRVAERLSRAAAARTGS
ncbi:penicillin-binding transpeptidase domain-containing protein [Streptomyces sp. NPDC045431]|uniref:penicillin-binding transpeptidase domain-containing protein n=1 Tax=Streptomyces sp. NPDC045431 TaxID=3155613 RepID=UPI0033C3C8FD